MQPLTLSTRLKLHRDVVMQEVAGESVLLNLATEQYYGLDEIGTFLLTALQQQGLVRQVYDAALDAYEVEAQALERDVLDLFADLLRHGLLETVD